MPKKEEFANNNIILTFLWHEFSILWMFSIRRFPISGVFVYKFKLNYNILALVIQINGISAPLIEVKDLFNKEKYYKVFLFW